jgi:hypothetical protein
MVAQRSPTRKDGRRLEAGVGELPGVQITQSVQANAVFATSAFGCHRSAARALPLLHLGSGDRRSALDVRVGHDRGRCRRFVAAIGRRSPPCLKAMSSTTRPVGCAPIPRERIVVDSPQGRFAADAKRIDGRVLDKVEAHGKHLFLRFEDLWVHVHLGLFGKWRIGKGEAPEPRGQIRMRLQRGRWLRGVAWAHRVRTAGRGREEGGGRKDRSRSDQEVRSNPRVGAGGAQQRTDRRATDGPAGLRGCRQHLPRGSPVPTQHLPVPTRQAGEPRGVRRHLGGPRGAHDAGNQEGSDRHGARRALAGDHGPTSRARTDTAVRSTYIGVPDSRVTCATPKCRWPTWADASCIGVPGCQPE